jgi:D-serine dehydratase
MRHGLRSKTMDTRVNILLEHLTAGIATTWLRPIGPAPAVAGLPLPEITDVQRRFERFQRPLARLFPDSGWDGQIQSPFERYPGTVSGVPELWVKSDARLPMTGSVKARGGVYELLCSIEDFALREQLIASTDDFSKLLDPASRASLSRHRVIVASTGNLGFSIGLVGRAFGVAVEVHMSSDAKAWKKDRLRSVGAKVIEHATDYEGAVAAARTEAAASGGYFIDDERSRRLFAGYAAAGRELAGQLAGERLQVSAARPLVVYLPCGVGGAPGGITAGLLHEFGDAVIIVFVEPIASACMFVALATGRRQSVYAVGLDNNTLADGLAVPTASELALALIGPRVDGVVAVPDSYLVDWTRRAWREANLRLEPSGAAGFAAVEPFLAARASRGDAIRDAIHVVWTTGGSLLPDNEFQRILASPDT